MRPQEIAQPKTQENTILMKVLNDSRYNLTDHRRLPNFENQPRMQDKWQFELKELPKDHHIKLCSIELIKSVQESFPLFASFNSSNLPRFIIQKINAENSRWQYRTTCIFQNHISPIQLNQRQRW
jgi:hypothetical protein